MPTAILDAFARPAYATMGSGVLYGRTEADERLRPSPPSHFADYLDLLGQYPWQRLVSESRALGSRGIIAAALLQKADYLSASDWRPYFMGEDGAYGERAEQLLEDTNHIICTRGERYDWVTLWKLAMLATHTDGGVFPLLTKSSEGWPLIQPIEAHRIGSRSRETEVKARSAWTQVRDDTGELNAINTPYVGLRLINGIIYNSAGAEVAYRVLGPTAEGDQDISARDMMHLGPPRWFSEGRPAPAIAPGLLDLLALQLARSSQLDLQILDSSLVAINSNETGKNIDAAKNAIMGGMAGPVGDPNRPPELVGRGQFKHIKNGNSLKPWDAKRPTSEWMGFDDKMLAASINSFWRVEMLDPSDLGGRNALLVQDAVNTHLRQAFACFEHAVKRIVRYRISCFTQLRLLPDHPEFLKWGITPPPEVVTDRNASMIDIALVRAGGMSMPDLHRRAGLRSKNVLTQQSGYEKMKDEIAKRDGIEPSRLGNLNQRGDVTRVDQISAAVSSGAITPDTASENAARQELDIPPVVSRPDQPLPAPTGSPVPAQGE